MTKDFMYKIALFPGDGIGVEVTEQVVRVIQKIAKTHHLVFEIKSDVLGGASLDRYGVPIRPEAIELAKNSDAVFLGAVGGPKWDNLESAKRPEKALLGLRQSLDVFANLRPVKM